MRASSWRRNRWAGTVLWAAWGVLRVAIQMKKQTAATFARIEEAQCALRDSIETTKRLVDDSDRLIRQHRQGQDRHGLRRGFA